MTPAEIRAKYTTGRPTSYTEEVLEKAWEYIEIHNEKRAVDELDEYFPSIVGLALYLQVSKSTVYDWAKSEGKEEFSYIVNAINAQQEKSLTQNGVAGAYNPIITKLLLSKHGYAEKQEVESTNTNLNQNVEIDKKDYAEVRKQMLEEDDC